ncbi:MAG: hypothetical protein HQL10_13905 [Nitrospirae bacterium]|nr:hypothetical protein [Nitrospirota bacterium]
MDASAEIPTTANVAKIQFRLWSDDNTVPLMIRVSPYPDGKFMIESAGPSGIVDLLLVNEKQAYYISLSHPSIHYNIGIVGWEL